MIVSRVFSCIHHNPSTPAHPKKLTLLDLLDDILGQPLELPERTHAHPHPLVDHLRQAQRLVGQLGPAAVQRNLEHGPDKPIRRLRDEHHVGHEREALQPQLRNVRLQQHIHLGARLLDALLDRDGHPLQQLGQLQLLFLFCC